MLDGGHDLYSALLHGETIERAGLTDGLGTVWRGDAAEFKYYPCAHVIQPYIAALLALRKTHRLQAQDIESVECTIAPWAAAIVCEPREAKLRFETELAAIASLPYQLAVALIEGHVDLRALSRQARARPDIAALAARITHRNDPQLGRTFDGTLVIRTRNGAAYEVTATTPGIDSVQVRSKFAANAAARLRSDRIERCVQSLSTSIDWRAAADALADH